MKNFKIILILFLLVPFAIFGKESGSNTEPEAEHYSGGDYHYREMELMREHYRDYYQNYYRGKNKGEKDQNNKQEEGKEESSKYHKGNLVLSVSNNTQYDYLIDISGYSGLNLDIDRTSGIKFLQNISKQLLLRVPAKKQGINKRHKCGLSFLNLKENIYFLIKLLPITKSPDSELISIIDFCSEELVFNEKSHEVNIPVDENTEFKLGYNNGKINWVLTHDPSSNVFYIDIYNAEP